MSKDKNMLLRIQSPEGTKRVEINGADSTSKLYEKVHDIFDLDSYAFGLYKERNQENEISSSKSRMIKNQGLRHGDMLYLVPINGALIFSSNSNNSNQSGEPVDSQPSCSTTFSHSRPSSAASANKALSNVKEDEVDVLLSKVDGKIKRKRDEKLCRHNSNSACVHCSPLEPFDDNYLKEQNIKHLSFHSHIRKLTSGVDRGKFLALEDISCQVKNGCKDHPPWPKGICSKCQPSAITLNRQVYRHVDNVAFENTNLVERFLNYWRTTGHQRVGILYGTYETHSDVPLGIRANVVAIYEPPQESSRDSIRLLHDEKEQLVDEIAHTLGLRRVGWIFTDLLPEDVQAGTVKHTRNIDSHFLSAQECIMAGYYQNKYPNPCRYSSSGAFGSKFVTVCVTGDKNNQVIMEGYQVSHQCMALVRDNCLLPTKDVPELGYVKESSDKQYVPDVYYKEKDSYGNEVSRIARPLPVEYLLVDVPASTPVNQQYTFNSDLSKEPFPVENRLIDSQIQDFNALSKYLPQFGSHQFFTAITDFHLLLYIATMDMLPMRDYIGPLLEAIRTKNVESAEEWARSEHWATVEQLIAASSPPPSRPGSVAGGSVNVGVGGANSSRAMWTCPFCTYINSMDLNECEMCRSARQ